VIVEELLMITTVGNAVLIAKKSKLVNRQELVTIPTPAPRGARHRPVPHHERVATLDGVLREAGLTIADERYAVGRGGSRLFGVLKVRPVEGHALVGAMREGQDLSIGLRSGNAGDVAIKLAAGLRVVVCDNMLLAGSFLALRRKHTTGLVLDGELREAVERYQVQQMQVVQETDRAREQVLTDDQARLAIFGAFERRIVAPRMFPEVVQNYFAPSPEWTDCTGRNRWALHNSFTRALRTAPAPVQFRATTALAYLLRAEQN
jgi:hypothetical protein